MWNAVKAIFRFLFLTAKKDAPALEAEIARILARANSEADKLRSSAALASLQKTAEDDIAAVQQTAEHHIALIKANLAAKLAEASKSLPSVAAQFGASGSTGPTGAAPTA